MLEGQYPPYSTLLPQQFDYQFTVERKSFDAALKRVAIVAENQNNTAKIIFDIKNQSATISTRSHHVGGAVESVLIRANSASEDKFYIGFNLKYLINALKYISTSEIIIKANRPTTPVIITPVNGNLDQLVLVMPLDLTNTWGEEIQSDPQTEPLTAQVDETAPAVPQSLEVSPETMVATQISEPVQEVPQNLEVSVAQTSQTETPEVSSISASATGVGEEASEVTYEAPVSNEQKPSKSKSNKTRSQAA